MLADLQTCAEAVARGGLIAYPTEGVFGLGCDPRDLVALEKLLALKQRDAGKGLILLAADFAQIRDFIAPLSAADEQTLLADWPGPKTWVIPAASDLPPLLTGGRDTIAVRVTAHAQAAALCRTCGPLTSTSANQSGQPALREARDVDALFGDQLDAVLDGKVGGLQGPTRIRDLRSGAVLR
jgi:L-threonylcarbamoyladenylate synthase